MALKFSTTVGQTVNRMKVLAVSDAEIVESIENLSAASEELFEAQADGAEIEQVLANLELAMNAVAQGGISKQVLGTFNSEGELMAACGCEALTVEGLEAMGENDVKALQAKVEAGLEGKMAEYWNKFVAWLKNLWAKIVNWFKNIFVSRARFVKALDAVKTMTEFDKEATVSTRGLWDTKKNNDCVAFCTAITKAVGDIAVAFETKDESKIDKLIEEVEAANKKAKEGGLDAILGAEKKSEKVSKFFTDLAQFKTTVLDYIKIAKDDAFSKAYKSIDRAFKNLIAEAGDAGKLEGAAAKEAKDLVNKKRQVLNSALAGIRNVNRCVMMQGGELLAIYKAANKKAAPAKKEEKK